MNVSSERRAIKAHGNNQLQTQRHFREPVSRRQTPQLNQEAYRNEDQQPQVQNNGSVLRSRPQTSQSAGDEACVRSDQEKCEILLSKRKGGTDKF